MKKAASLLEQTLPAERWEWIVAFDGPRPELERALADHVAGRIAFRSLALDQAGPGPARDAAAAIARFPVLYLSDDDCLPASDALERHGEAQRRPGVYLGTVIFVDDGHEEVATPPRNPGWWHLAGANTSLPADAFHAVGGFGSATEGYGGEDLWLGRRLSLRGVPFRRLAGAVVRHLGPDPRRSGDRGKAYQAGVNAVRLARRDPGLAWRLGVQPWLLRVKRVALALPAMPGDAARRRYEQEYARGAREAWATPTGSERPGREEDRA